MGELRDSDIDEMTVPTWERAKAAIRAGETDEAVALVDKAVAQWRSPQDYSINWITSTLSFIADEMGGETARRALRRTGEGVVFSRRTTHVARGGLAAPA